MFRRSSRSRAFASPQIVRRIADDFQAPTFVMTAINFERQLPSKFTLFAVAFNYRGKHLLRVRNINAPLPGLTIRRIRTAPFRPFGNIGDIYYYESSANFNDYRFFGGLRRQMSKGFSVFANFGSGRGKTDTDCIFGSIANCFPADSYDVSSEYSRVAFIPSGNFFFGGTFIVPKAQSEFESVHRLFDGPCHSISSPAATRMAMGCLPNDRRLRPRKPIRQILRRTRFGDFDLAPAPGQELIPRNYGMGPSFFSVNLGISRSIAFGNVPAPAAAAAKPAAPDGSPAGTQPAHREPDQLMVQLPKSDIRLRSQCQHSKPFEQYQPVKSDR